MELVTPGIGLIFWQTLTFIIVLLILRRFAWNPITSALRDRENSIETALRAAEQARTEMSQLKAENEKLIESARIERDAMVKKAQQTADAIIAEAKTKATAESNKIVEIAKQQINSERLAALQDIKNQVAVLSVEIAEKILRQQLNEPQAQRTYVNDLVQNIKLN